MDFVSMEAVLRALRRVLPEQRWRSQSGKVDIKSICEALEASFAGDGAVSPKEVAKKLEALFYMNPALKDKANELARYLIDEMRREHAARVKTRLLVVPPPFVKGSATSTPQTSASPSPTVTRKNLGMPPMPKPIERASLKDLETSAQFGALVLQADELSAKVTPPLLEAAGVPTYAALLQLPDVEMVAALWRASPPLPLPSMHPKNVVYTSGSSGYKATGLVQDTGGYTSGVSNTMSVVFDARAGVDVILTDAAPSWVTGQTYGITGPLTNRITSILCTAMPEATMAQCLAAVVQRFNVTIFVASASFLKRAVKTTWQARWLQRQHLHEHLRVASSCGEPLSPSMHKLGMALLCPNYINSYWASEHGAIVLARTFGNGDQPVAGDAKMYAMPWVDAAVWVPAGPPTEDGRVRFVQAEALPNMEGHAGGPSGNEPASPVHAKDVSHLKGRLVVTKPWPSMARTVWGDAELAATSGWVGDLDTFRARYWSTFCDAEGEPMMALDLADLARPWADGSFSVLGHSREELRLGPDGVVVAAAELEATMQASSSELIDVVVVSMADPHRHIREDKITITIPIACLVMPEGTTLTEEMANEFKMATFAAHGENCVPVDFVRIPAIPRTHNSKPMRNVLQRLFNDDAGGLADVSEIANPTCLLELKAAIDEWRFEQASSMLDQRI